MRTFVTTRGIKFSFYDIDRERLILTDRAPINADLEEYVAFIREERESIERGPRPVPQRARLLLNGTAIDIDYSPQIAPGSAYYFDVRGNVVVLEEGGTPALAEVPIRTEGTVQVGATVVAKK